MLIYIPGSSENEKESAELFVRAAGDHFRPSFIARFMNLLLVTTHKELAQECNKQFVADIDLSSFGVDWEEFLRDTNAVREEQADSSDAVFYPAHTKFLNSLLGRPRIFGTEFLLRTLRTASTGEYYPFPRGSCAQKDIPAELAVSVRPGSS